MTKTVTLTLSDDTFLVPAKDILAVWNTVSKDKTRYYLQGVFIEKDEREGVVTLISTNGHMLLKKIAPVGSYVGDNVADQKTQDRKGFILLVDVMEKGFKALPHADIWAYGNIATGIIEFINIGHGEPEDLVAYDRTGVCEFSRVDGTFPDWRRVLPCETAEGSSYLSFNADYITTLQKAAKVYGSKGSLVLSSGDPTHPIKVGFSGVPLLSGVLMPMRK
jgi:hypothetical protein